jgi:Ca2+ transporting ATPase
VAAAAAVAAVCGDAEVERDPDTLRYRAVGAPTEAALKVMVEKLARSQPTVSRLCGALTEDRHNDDDDDDAAAASMRACNFWYTHDRALDSCE